jgi:hypothetical protein
MFPGNIIKNLPANCKGWKLFGPAEPSGKLSPGNRPFKIKIVVRVSFN